MLKGNHVKERMIVFEFGNMEVTDESNFDGLLKKKLHWYRLRRECGIEEVDLVTLDNFFKRFCCKKKHKSWAVHRRECEVKGRSFKMENNSNKITGDLIHI